MTASVLPMIGIGIAAGIEATAGRHVVLGSAGPGAVTALPGAAALTSVGPTRIAPGRSDRAARSAAGVGRSDPGLG
jgi:hypothetical protein